MTYDQKTKAIAVAAISCGIMACVCGIISLGCTIGALLVRCGP